MAFSLTFFVAPVYIVFFSSLPIKYFAKSIEKDGLKFEGLSGSLMSGVRADSITYRSKSYEIQIRQAVFGYDGIALLTRQDPNTPIVIDEISAQGGEIRYLNNIKQEAVGLVASQMMKKPTPPPPKPNSKPGQSNVGRIKAKTAKKKANRSRPRNDVVIKKLEIKNFFLKMKGMTSEQKLERLFMKNFSMIKNVLNLEEFDFKHELINLSGQSIMVGPRGKRNFSIGGIAISLKPMFMDMIEKELNLTLVAQGTDEKTNIDLREDNKKFIVQTDMQSGTIYFKDFSPNDYLSVDFPFDTLSFRLDTNPTMGPAFVEAQGFYIYQGKFFRLTNNLDDPKSEKGKFTLSNFTGGFKSKNGNVFWMTFNPMAMFTGRNKILLSWQNKPEATLDQALAQLIYEKPYSALGPIDQGKIITQKKFFLDAPAGILSKFRKPRHLDKKKQLLPPGNKFIPQQKKPRLPSNTNKPPQNR